MNLLSIDPRNHPVPEHMYSLIQHQGEDGPAEIGLFSTREEAEAAKAAELSRVSGWTEQPWLARLQITEVTNRTAVWEDLCAMAVVDDFYFYGES